MKHFIFLVTFIILTFASRSYAIAFRFDNNTEQWGSWGTGLGAHDSKVGHTEKGSLWLSSDWGEVQTVHFNWNNLSPGTYKVTAYVRAQDVQPHPDGSTFWHFYDGGKGTENVFLDLSGSYEWRKIEYTLKVLKNNLSIWFRLKSPGQVWIDDLSISPTNHPLADINISAPSALKREIPQTKITNKTHAVVTLLDFDKASPSHPFNTITNQENKDSLN